MSSIINGIKKALAAGYTANTLLDALGNKSPENDSMIKKATKAGFTANTILRMIAGGGDDDDVFDTEYERAKRAQSEWERRRLSQTLGVIGAFGAAAKAFGPLALLGTQSRDEIVPGIEPAKLEPQGLTESGIAGYQPQPIQKVESKTETPDQVKPEITPAADILLGKQKPITPAKPAIDVEKGILPQVSELEEQTGKVKFIDDMARRMLTTGKSPEQIYEEMKPTKVSGPYVKMYEDKQGKSYLDRIREIASESPEQIKEEIEKPKASIKFEAPSVKEKQIAPTRGEPVITPEGQVGDLRQIGKNKGIVNVDGKMYEFALNELTTLPKAYEKFEVDLTNIPEVDKSAPLREVAITPDKKMIVTKFWSWGEEPKGAYIYKRKDGQAFDDDFITKLVTEATPAKTTGDQFTGAWTPGGLSRGAGFHEYLKSNSQAFDAEDDPDKPFIYMPTLYEYLHPYEERVSKSLKTAKREFDIERKGIKADEKKAKRKKEI